jgi:site-specific DNA recombinase
VIYTRISRDKGGDKHGVVNQAAACRKYAKGRGWRVLEVLDKDNDLSAFNGKHRPDYEKALGMVDRGEVDVVLCWRLDRFVRRIADLESVITRFERAGAKLATVTGDLDLGTGPGRMVGRMLSVIAQGEVEAKGERQKLANEARAKAGQRPASPHRPFGYQPGGVEADPVEADAIQWAADCLLGGGTISAVMREWERRGLVTAQTARPFTRQSITSILRNPRIAGLRTYRGEIVSAEPGQWDAILPEATWRAVDALLAASDRTVTFTKQGKTITRKINTSTPKGVRTLLGGLAVCQCGNPVTAMPNHRGYRVYRCSPATRDGRPGPHVAVRAAPVDDTVRARVTDRLSWAELADLIDPPRHVDTAALRTEAASIRRNLDEMGADRALGLISRSQMITATERGHARLAEIAAELAESAGAGALAPFAEADTQVKAEAVWDELDLSRQRAVLAALGTVTLRPAGRGARQFDPRTVDISTNRSS